MSPLLPSDLIRAFVVATDVDTPYERAGRGEPVVLLVRDPGRRAALAAPDAPSAEEFLRAVARFDSATSASAFFARHDSLHRAMEAQLARVLGGWIDLVWFRTEFGLRPDARLIAVPGLQRVHLDRRPGRGARDQ